MDILNNLLDILTLVGTVAAIVLIVKAFNSVLEAVSLIKQAIVVIKERYNEDREIDKSYSTILNNINNNLNQVKDTSAKTYVKVEESARTIKSVPCDKCSNLQDNSKMNTSSSKPNKSNRKPKTAYLEHNKHIAHRMDKPSKQ